eukprot:10887967-Ditylum_brightwellii.AAC.1
MAHPHNGTLDDVDDNNIGYLTPHGISARTEGAIMLHGVDGGVDGGETHLTNLTQKVDCNLVWKMKQNAGGEYQDHRVPNVMKSRSLLSESAKSNDGKEAD